MGYHVAKINQDVPRSPTNHDSNVTADPMSSLLCHSALFQHADQAENGLRKRHCSSSEASVESLLEHTFEAGDVSKIDHCCGMSEASTDASNSATGFVGAQYLDRDEKRVHLRTSSAPASTSNASQTLSAERCQWEDKIPIHVGGLLLQAFQNRDDYHQLQERFVALQSTAQSDVCALQAELAAAHKQIWIFQSELAKAREERKHLERPERFEAEFHEQHQAVEEDRRRVAEDLGAQMAEVQKQHQALEEKRRRVAEELEAQRVVLREQHHAVEEAKRRLADDLNAQRAELQGQRHALEEEKRRVADGVEAQKAELQKQKQALEEERWRVAEQMEARKTEFAEEMSEKTQCMAAELELEKQRLPEEKQMGENTAEKLSAADLDEVVVLTVEGNVTGTKSAPLAWCQDVRATMVAPKKIAGTTLRTPAAAFVAGGHRRELPNLLMPSTLRGERASSPMVDLRCTRAQRTSWPFVDA